MTLSYPNYPYYSKRNTQSLDGVWDFHFVVTDAAFKDLEINAVVYNDIMAVPGAFDAGPKYAGKRGCGIYRTHVATEAGLYRLRIQGIGLRARVFWDGREIAATELPYSPLTVKIETDANVHELVIATDNRFEETNSTLVYRNYDFYCYGGIYRSVDLQKLPPARIDRAYVRTLDLERGEVSVRLLLGGNAIITKNCKVGFDGGTPVDVPLNPAQGIAEFTARVPNPSIWSLENPNLHTIHISLDSGDEIVERFGLRTIEARKGQILLNGKAIRLRGYCRHEANPQLGPALPDALQLEDVQYLKESHCNFVRCVHYPQDQTFFDLCDQYGILVWTESLGWGDIEERLIDPSFGELQELQTRQMIQDAFNHPSIIIWAFLNEGASHTPGSQGLYARLVDAIHEEDPSRLASFASNRLECDINLGLVDIISMNIYPLWFMDLNYGDIHDMTAIGRNVDRLAKFCDREDLKDKPFIFSEIGTCGLYGWRDRLDAPWSEAYQAAYCVEAVRCIFENPRLSGVSLWQFYDSRSLANGELRGKARTFNNAGALDEYKRPKLAFDAVKRAFKAISESE